MKQFKQRMQGMVVGFLVAALIFGASAIYAANTRTIEVTFGGVITTLFGEEYVVRDDDGLVIEPITYDGRAYIPVESILHSMQENAQWNEATKILNFGTPDIQSANQASPLNEVASHFDGRVPNFGTGNSDVVRFGESIPRANVSRDGLINVQNVEMGGREFIDATRYFAQPWHGNGASMYTLHNLNGQFTFLSGYIGRVDGSALTNASIRFYGDDQRLRTIQLNSGALPEEFSINVQGVRLLKIEIVVEETPARLGTRAVVEYALYAYIQ